MVKLVAPMMSLEARGKFGKAIVYYMLRGVACARMLVQPFNPNSDSQRSFRAMMTFLSQVWADLSPANQATWVGLAEIEGYAPFNGFVSINMSQWDLYDAPGKEYPICDTGAGGDAPTTTPTAGVKQIGLSIAHGVASPVWGWLIHSSLTTGFTPGRGTLLKALATAADPDLWVDAPLETGVPVYYRVQGFSDDGVLGTLEAEVTATPT